MEAIAPGSTDFEKERKNVLVILRQSDYGWDNRTVEEKLNLSFFITVNYFRENVDACGRLSKNSVLLVWIPKAWAVRTDQGTCTTWPDDLSVSSGFDFITFITAASIAVSESDAVSESASVQEGATV